MQRTDDLVVNGIELKVATSHNSVVIRDGDSGERLIAATFDFLKGSLLVDNFIDDTCYEADFNRFADRKWHELTEWLVGQVFPASQVA